MEQRNLKVSFNKSGSGSISSSIRIPITWVKEMGIDKDNRGVVITFNEGKIVIEKATE